MIVELMCALTSLGLLNITFGSKTLQLALEIVVEKMILRWLRWELLEDIGVFHRVFTHCLQMTLCCIQSDLVFFIHNPM